MDCTWTLDCSSCSVRVHMPRVYQDLLGPRASSLVSRAGTVAARPLHMCRGCWPFPSVNRSALITALQIAMLISYPPCQHTLPPHVHKYKHTTKRPHVRLPMQFTACSKSLQVLKLLRVVLSILATLLVSRALPTIHSTLTCNKLENCSI